MKDLLKRFEAKPAEVVFHWHDSETEAEGWCVINSLRGGAAGGGTRMSLSVDEHEVLSLAKTMEIKFSVAGPAIGGAKSGIRFNPNDERKSGVLRRWYTALKPLLKTYYGTGGDLNVDEIHEVIPFTAELGIDHPQEGVFNGHYRPNIAQKAMAIQRLQQGVLLPLSNERYTPLTDGTLTVADMITGYGVAESIAHFAGLHQLDLQSKKAIIQGWGNVASAAAWYLGNLGVKVVGIIDRNGGIIAPQGLGIGELRDLFLNKRGNELIAQNLLEFDKINEVIWDQPHDIFVPAAASRLVTDEQLLRMHKAGLRIISSGANVPFADKEIFFGPISEKADTMLACIPDFISNCGMARVFAYLMNPDFGPLEEQAIFDDVSAVIKKALEAVYERNTRQVGVTATAYDIALEKLIHA